MHSRRPGLAVLTLLQPGRGIHVPDMMEPVPRMDACAASPLHGSVHWDAAKMAWFGTHALIGLAGLFIATPAAVITAFALTWLLILLGHSVGYHRLLMHGNFQTSKFFGRALILCGALLGSAGPSAIIRVHDERDWAQRAPETEGGCHPYYSQHGPFLRDMAWQLFARIDLDHPPRFQPDPVWGHDPFVRHLDRWWRLYALAPAVPLYLTLGWAGVALGVSARIFAVNAGHWMVNHICHHPGLHIRYWSVPANGVQANDLLRPNALTGLLAGLLTAGECWHANHHAFPESANTALAPHQFDPGYHLLKALARLGLVWNIREPRAQCARGDLVLT